MRIDKLALLITAMLLGILAACTAESAAMLVVHTPTPAVNAAPASSEYTVSGTLTRGQGFSQDLAPNLTFQLLPTEQGWELWVGDPTLSSAAADNFAMPATPPFYGINTRQIDGWHFRNSDNSGPNGAGDKNVNAPQAVRPFCFVGNQDDFQLALDALATGLPALADAVATDAFPLHRGMLTITDYTLGNLIPGEQAWFDEMAFTVTLDLDQPCDLF